MEEAVKTEVSGKKTERKALDHIVNILYSPLGILPEQEKIQKVLPRYNIPIATMYSALLEGLTATYILCDLFFSKHDWSGNSMMPEVAAFFGIGLTGFHRMLESAHQRDMRAIPSWYVNVPYQAVKRIYQKKIKK